jgi:hypothetical protein
MRFAIYFSPLPFQPGPLVSISTSGFTNRRYQLARGAMDIYLVLDLHERAVVASGVH